MNDCPCLNPLYREAHFQVTKPSNGWPASFGIVTACNPYGNEATDEENERATERLRSELDAASIFFFEATGGSKDMTYQEKGFAITFAALEEAIQCGKRHHQDAVFWIEDDKLLLVCCKCPRIENIDSWEKRVL
jgi:hypothetical protein